MVLYLTEGYNTMSIISNATGDLLMDYEIMQKYHSKKNDKAQTIELHCIEPFFEYMGEGANNPFTEKNKVFTQENFSLITAALMTTNCSNNTKASYIFEKIVCYEIYR